MNARRRQFLIALAATAATMPSLALAQADTYPSKPITLIAPGGPGGAVDTVARVFGQRLAVALGGSVVVDARPGAGGNIGTAAVAKAPRDGYTLLMAASSSQTINPSLYAQIPFDAVKDFEPIATIASAPHVLVVHPGVPAQSVPELIALAKSRPGVLNYGSVGNGSLNHLLAEQFKQRAGVNLIHVPYKTAAAAMTDTVSNQVQLNFASLTVATPFIKSGQVRVLAVVTATRSALAPGVPTIAETLPGYVGNSWYGLMAPSGIPRAARDRLLAAAGESLKSPEFSKQLAAQGLELMPGTPAEFSTLIQSDLAYWAETVKSTGARLD